MINDIACKCDVSVLKSFKDLVYRKKSGTMLTLKKRLNVTRRFAEIVITGVTVCYMHIKASATCAGMRTRFDHATLKHRLVVMS